MSESRETENVPVCEEFELNGIKEVEVQVYYMKKGQLVNGSMPCRGLC